MTDINFNGVSLTTAVPGVIVTSVRRGLLGTTRDVYQEVPGRAGAWLFPEQPGNRSVTVGVHLLADTPAGRRAAVVALATWADSTQAGQLIIDDEPDRYWEAKLTGTPEPDEAALFAEVELEWRVGPYAWALALSTRTWATGSGDFTIPDDVGARPIMEIVCSSTAPNCTITAWSTGAVLTCGAAIAPTFTVNGISYMVTGGANTDTQATGSFTPAQVAMAGVAGTFPTLIPGHNVIQVAVTALTGVTLTWRRRYRG